MRARNGALGIAVQFCARDGALGIAVQIRMPCSISYAKSCFTAATKISQKRTLDAMATIAAKTKGSEHILEQNYKSTLVLCADLAVDLIRRAHFYA
eukprot:2141768-Pleurochrysis_carterae.AAC.1